MAYQDCKVYNDGSHYIAIHTFQILLKEKVIK